MTMAEFIKGMRVTTQETKYGEIIKLGIKWDEFQTNPVNDKGYLNIDILTSREGKKYAALNTYKSNSKPVTAETIADEFDGEIVQFDGGIDITDEEIPW
jgi:hypothetical protein